MRFLCPSMWPPFADLSVITYSVDAYRAGFYPWLSGEFNPYNVLYIYPKLWIYIFDFLNLTADKTYFTAIGSILIYSFLLSKYFIPNGLNKSQGFLCTFLLLSPIQFLLLERGNSDLFICILGIISIRLLYFNSIWGVYASYFIILICFSLKLYAIVFLIPFFLRIENKKHLNLFLILTLIYVSWYIYINLETLKIINQNTPKDSYLTYGRRIIFLKFISKGFIANTISWLVSFIVFFLSISNLINKKKNYIVDVNLTDFKTTLFLAGSSTYLSTFILFNNYEYRLIFLFYCFPFLFQNRHIIPIKLRVLFLLAIFIRFWQYIPFNYLTNNTTSFDYSILVFITEQICSWFLFSFLLYYSLLIILRLIDSKYRLFSTFKIVMK